tara:strand:+ start:19865 stop:19999 length:135 start_codon:yes stop_codon:yes gene_type:complete
MGEFVKFLEKNLCGRKAKFGRENGNRANNSFMTLTVKFGFQLKV